MVPCSMTHAPREALASIPEDRAKVYETDLKQGGIVMGVKPRNDEDIRYFESEWQAQPGRR
jgi:hypothetical protein